MRAWIASLAVHAAVIAAIVMWWRTPQIVVEESLAPHASVAIEVVPPAPPPQVIEVAFVDSDPIVAPAATRATAATMRGRGAAQEAHAAASTGDNTTETTGTEPTGVAGTGTRHLGMRGPELHPTDEALGHIAEQPGHVGTTPIPSHRIENGVAIHDAVTDVTIAKDGTVTFHDKPDTTIHFDATPWHVWHSLRGIGATIADLAQAPSDSDYVSWTDQLPAYRHAVDDVCTQYAGTASCEDPTERGAVKAMRKGSDVTSIVSGKLDITSALMRKFVGDPFASRKLKLLDDTRLERAEKGLKYNEEQLARADQLMQQNLERLWAGTQNPDERRAVLFELWDECTEGEGLQAEAGGRARKMVVGWIRARIPAGSAGAYTAHDIAALDAHRTSHAHFAPYEP